MMISQQNMKLLMYIAVAFVILQMVSGHSQQFLGIPNPFANVMSRAQSRGQQAAGYLRDRGQSAYSRGMAMGNQMQGRMRDLQQRIPAYSVDALTGVFPAARVGRQLGMM